MAKRVERDEVRRVGVAGARVATATSVIVDSRNDRAIGLDDYLFRDRTLYLVGPVNEDSAHRVVLALHVLSRLDPKAEITLYIDSPGGLVTAGNAILEAMDEIPNDIRTRCIGQAASMGAIIFAHGTRGKREIGPRSRVLIHQPSAGTSGKTTDEEIDVAESRRLRKQLATTLAEDSGQTAQNVERDFKDDLWLNAEQAIEYGLADAMIKVRRKGFAGRAVSPPSVRASEVLSERVTERRAADAGKGDIAA